MGQEPVDSCVKPQASKLGCETGGALRLIHDTGALLCDIPYYDIYALERSGKAPTRAGYDPL